MNKRFSKKFVVAVGILVIMSGAAVVGIVRYVEGNKWVSHTHQVIDALNGIESDLVDAETGQRGYVITGKDQYLKPFADSQERLEADLEKVQLLISDNKTAQKQYAKILPLVGQRLMVLKRNLELRKTKGFKAAESAISQGVGLATMQEIRARLEEMKQGEYVLLAQRDRDAVTRLYVLIGILTIGAGAVIVFVVMGAIAELALARSLSAQVDVLKIFVTALPVPVVMTDNTMTILAVSDEWRTRFGVTAKNLIGKSYYDVAVVPDKWKQNHKEVLTVGKSFIYRDDSLTVMGRTEYVNRRLVPWYLDGKVAGLIAVTQFITEEINTRAELERIHVQVDELEKAKDDLIRVVGARIKGVEGATGAKGDTGTDGGV